MLVIFDCDGVLVDSELLAAKVFSAELQKNGVLKSPEQCLATFKGHTLPACLDILANEGAVLPKDFLAELRQSTDHSFSRELKQVAGVEQVLIELQRRNIRFCVASNGGYQKIQHSLKTTRLWEYFDGVCFSAESVKQGKPAPDLFLWAAAQMGYRAQDVVIIEDSFTGLTAGVAAKMRVFFYCAKNEGGQVESVMIPSPVTCFSEMAQLIEMLGLGVSEVKDR